METRRSSVETQRRCGGFGGDATEMRRLRWRRGGAQRSLVETRRRSAELGGARRRHSAELGGDAGALSGTRSQARAISNPAVTANPATAPAMGLRHAAMAATGSAAGSLTSPLKTFSTAVRSTPEQKAQPRPARTTADPWGPAPLEHFVEHLVGGELARGVVVVLLQGLLVVGEDGVAKLRPDPVGDRNPGAVDGGPRGEARGEGAVRGVGVVEGFELRLDGVGGAEDRGDVRVDAVAEAAEELGEWAERDSEWRRRRSERREVTGMGWFFLFRDRFEGSKTVTFQLGPNGYLWAEVITAWNVQIMGVVGCG
uniref:Uncharacterized protein n=1 Tax=Ananas comosus var. bracteatus TaxID=296719 RepID=A0A6V7NGU9_ANACO|nr:unnamed protein product [Ananas comosus var. bracteatus]